MTYCMTIKLGLQDVIDLFIHPVITVRRGLAEHQGTMLSLNQKPRPMIMVKFFNIPKSMQNLRQQRSKVDQ